MFSASLSHQDKYYASFEFPYQGEIIYWFVAGSWMQLFFFLQIARRELVSAVLAGLARY